MPRAITLGAFLIFRNGGYIMSNERIGYRIIANVGIFAKQSNDWRKEFNIVLWNEGFAKLDIREWSPEHDKMSKEITLTYKCYSKSEPLSYYSEPNLMFRGDR